MWDFIQDTIDGDEPATRRERAEARRAAVFARRRFMWLWALPAVLCLVGYLLLAALTPGGWSAGLLFVAAGIALFVAGLVVEGRRF